MFQPHLLVYRLFQALIVIRFLFYFIIIFRSKLHSYINLNYLKGGKKKKKEGGMYQLCFDSSFLLIISVLSKNSKAKGHCILK